MHLGLICYEYPPAKHGGVGSFSKDLAEGLVSAGHEVSVVGVYQPAIMQVASTLQELNRGVRIVRLPPMLRVPTRVRLIADRLRLRQWLLREHRRNPFDIIEAPDATGWLAFGSPASVPTVARLHGSQTYLDQELDRPGSRMFHWLEKRWLARANHLVAVSDYVGTRTLELTGLYNRKITTIHNAVDTNVFAPDPYRNIDIGRGVFVNSISPKKGVFDLIKAVNIVAMTEREFRLTLIGKNLQRMKDGRLLSEHLLDLVHPEFRNRVKFTGAMDRTSGVIPCLQAAHLCCYPSHSEAFGIAPIEAMALEKPVIYTRTGPGPEVIEDGISGLLCDPTNPEDIAEKILTILRDRHFANEIAVNARLRVLDKFDAKNWIQKNINFYESVL